MGADVTINVSTTSSEERVDLVRQLTGGRGADVVLHMANRPASFVEGIEMLKRGGMMLEMGVFADTGDVAINVHRHICSKNIRLIGMTNHPSTGYGPALASWSATPTATRSRTWSATSTPWPTSTRRCT